MGSTNVVYTVNAISSGASFEIEVEYDGNTVTTGEVSASGTLTFNKDNVSVETSDITITYTGDIELTVLAECCGAIPLTIVQVVVTNYVDSGDTIHT